jgi:hypothetical protein
VERRVDLVLTQPWPVISQPPLDKLHVEGVLGVLQEPLPGRDGRANWRNRRLGLLLSRAPARADMQEAAGPLMIGKPSGPARGVQAEP